MSNWKYCTPEQGMRLAELGIESPSRMFYQGELVPASVVYLDGVSPVWDVAELLVLCPPDTNLFRGAISGEWYTEKRLFDSYDHAAECLAGTLIFLLENNHVTAADCNKRLREVNDAHI